jgi:hypothetical protein
MTDDELRRLVREAVARQLGQAPVPPVPVLAESRPASLPATRHGSPWADHASHYQYVIVNPTDTCVIEPGVGCNHCGYCKSHGH